MAISSIIYTILSIIIGTIVLIVYLVTDEKKKGKRRVAPNPPLFENKARMQFTNGYASGEIVSQKRAKNGCTLIEFYPIGVEHGEYVPKPDIQSVVVLNECLDRYAKGDIEGKRELIIAYGRSPSDYPERYRETLEGKGALGKVESAHIKATYGKWIDNILKTLSLHMKEHAGGLISANTLMEIKSGMENLKVMMLANQQQTEKKE